MGEPFSFLRARQLAEVFRRHDAEYLFLGNGGAVLLGFSDMTQAVEIFVRKSPENGARIAAALKELGFELTDAQTAEILRGKDFVQLKNGPFDLDLIFAPDGIERFEDADARKIVVEGLPVCHIDDIIASKEAAGRVRDRESLPRLRAFRDWWLRRRGG